MVSTYTTTQGDAWDLIAYQLWGDERLMLALIRANREYADVVIFSAGVVLVVPDLPETASAASLPPWRK